VTKTITERAVELSKLGYTIELLRDRTTEGEHIYMARNPELEGCMAQGLTSEEALANLDEVRIEHIEHLLEHSLPIPQPARSETTIKEKVVQKVIPGVTFQGFEDYLIKVVQPDEREILYSITPNI